MIKNRNDSAEALRSKVENILVKKNGETSGPIVLARKRKIVLICSPLKDGSGCTHTMRENLQYLDIGEEIVVVSGDQGFVRQLQQLRR